MNRMNLIIASVLTYSIAAAAGLSPIGINPHLPEISPQAVNVVYGSTVTLVASDAFTTGSQWFNTTGVQMYQSENMSRYKIAYGINATSLVLNGLKPGSYVYTFCIANGNSSSARGWKYNKNFCSTADVSVSEPAFKLIALTVSAPVVDVGQNETLTAYISGGVPPYIYNFYVYNATNVMVDSASYGNVSYTSNSFEFQLLPQWGTGNFNVDVTVMDSTGSFAQDPVTFESSISNASLR